MLHSLEGGIRAAAEALAGWLPLIPACAGLACAAACAALSHRRVAAVCAAAAMFFYGLTLAALVGEWAAGASYASCALFALLVSAVLLPLCLLPALVRKAAAARPGKPAPAREKSGARVFAEDDEYDVSPRRIPREGEKPASPPDPTRTRKEMQTGLRPAEPEPGYLPPAGGADALPEPVRAAARAADRPSADPRKDGYRAPADFAGSAARPAPLPEEEPPADSPGDLPAETPEQCAEEEPPESLRALGERRRRVKNPLMMADMLPEIKGGAPEKAGDLGREHVREIIKALRAARLEPADEREVRAAELLLASPEAESGGRALNDALAGLVRMMAKYRL